MKNSIKNYSWLRIFVIFALFQATLRSIFFIWGKKQITFSLIILLKTFFTGLFFDLLTLSYIALIPLLYYALLPSKFFNKNLHQKFVKFLYFTFLYIITFSLIAEIVFWEEFQARFNFIAVDYLIYTTEVIGNIFESYPVFPLLIGIFLFAAFIFYLTNKKVFTIKQESFGHKFRNFIIFISLLSVGFFTIDSKKITEISENKYINEIAANGIYQLFSAYFNNEIDYDKLYATNDIKEVNANLRNLILKQEPKSKFLDEEGIARIISKPRISEAEKKYNIILISIESLSADFMSSFGNTENITPNLDSLAKKSLFFTNLKAAGTRTVRGLESLSLSIPPTPGNSIVRRPNNENMFNISSPLKARGYDAKFIYGGFGYFDNMNYFFANNGFEIIDRQNFTNEEISFANVWGVADEDLFDKTIKEADKSYSKGKQFINFVMTTSNHRPFTYPDGKIDIKSKSGRNGAVKYTDYAIGQLVKKAQLKPWFDKTIFIFVADHCAGSAGNTDVPLWRYQIPAMFYAPKIIKPRIFKQNISQVDIAPTIIGLLNFSYKSKFFGTDVLNNEKTINQHAFVGTYSDVGYFKNNALYLLKPKKEIKVFDVTFKNYGWQGSREEITQTYQQKDLEAAISYYQGASYLFSNGKLKNFD